MKENKKKKIIQNEKRFGSYFQNGQRISPIRNLAEVSRFQRPPGSSLFTLPHPLKKLLPYKAARDVCARQEFLPVENVGGTILAYILLILVFVSAFTDRSVILSRSKRICYVRVSLTWNYRFKKKQ